METSTSEVLVDPSLLPQTELDLSIDFDALFRNISTQDLYNNNNELEQLDSSPLSMSPYTQFTPALQDINGLDYLPQIDPLEFMQTPAENIPHSPLQNLTPQKRQTRRSGRTTNEKKPRTQAVVKVKQEPQLATTHASSQEDVKLLSPKKERDDKYKKRLAANKKSAQASRERKKVLKDELELKVDQLETENSQLATAITEMETENKVLKREFISLQKLINESVVLSKLMAQVNFQPPQDTTSIPSSPSQSVPSSPQPSAPSTPLPDQQPINRLVQNLSGPLPFPPLPASNSEAANAAYLMIVLYSFNQYFGNLPGFSMNNLLQALPQTRVM